MQKTYSAHQLFWKMLILVPFISCVFFPGYAQILTNAQVYDYDVGDIFQCGYFASDVFGPLGPPNYETRTITGKYFTPGNDTIVYSVSSFYYTPPSCPTCPPSFQTGSSTLVISQLSDTADHKNETTCLILGDTMLMDYCARLVWERKPVQDPGCFEPTHHTTRFVEGLGGTYYRKIIPSAVPAQILEYTLIYYNKGGTTCGTLETTVPEFSKGYDDVNLYPNPAEAFLNINSEITFLRYDIFDQNGRVVLIGNLKDNTIDINLLPASMYVLALYNRNNEVVFRQFQKAE